VGELDSSGSDLMADWCENGDEAWEYSKNFLDQLSDYQLLKIESVILVLENAVKTYYKVVSQYSTRRTE
jgi:hypothetical protein